MQTNLTFEAQKPYFIEQDCFRQVSDADSQSYCVFEWRQLARFYFYQFYFKHDFDLIYLAKTSAVKFLIGGKEVMVAQGANIIIPAKTPYSFRGFSHHMNEMLCVGPVNARHSWEAAARATLEAESSGAAHPRVS